MKEARAALYVKGYDLLLWLVRWAEKVPRGARRFHADEILEAARAHLLACSLALSFSEGRLARLQQADEALVRLRLALRLAGDCGVLNDRNRHFLMPQLEELGRMLGGWRKYEWAARRRYEQIEGEIGFQGARSPE